MCIIVLTLFYFILFLFYFYSIFIFIFLMLLNECCIVEKIEMLIYRINKLADDKQRDNDSNDRYIYYDRNCIRFQNNPPRSQQVQTTGFCSTSTTIQLRLQKNRFPLRISLLLWWNSTTNTRRSERRRFITRNETSNKNKRNSNKATNEKEILHLLLQSTQTCE